MSEFWVSGKKYWCKFCRTFVYDNRACRQNHDSSQKHKDNVKKYLRNLEIKAGKAKYDTSKPQIEPNKSGSKLSSVNTGGTSGTRTQLSYQSKREAKYHEDLNILRADHLADPLNEYSLDLNRQATASFQPSIKIKAPPPAKVKRVLETRIGEWQVVSKPTEDEKPKEDPPEAEDAFDEDDLSTFRLTQKTYPSNTIDLADEEEKNEPFVEPTSLFRKRKAANKAIRKK